MKRFRLVVDLDWATMHCPCGASARTDVDDYDAWKKLHAAHTGDGGKSYAETHIPSAWSKCFSGPCPAPRVVKP